MVDYFYRAQPAVSSEGDRIAEEGTGSVYAISDTTFATPLTVTLASGATSTVISVSFLGQTEGFTVADQPEVYFKSGDFVSPLVAWSSVIADALASRQAAESAATAADQSRVVAEQALAQVQALIANGGGGVGGILSHHDLSNNNEGDDHPQYLTTARADQLYTRSTSLGQLLNNLGADIFALARQRSQHTGSQAISTVTGLESRLAALEAGGGGGGVTFPIALSNVAFTTTGLALAGASSEGAARSAIGAGQSNLALGGPLGNTGSGQTALPSSAIYVDPAPGAIPSTGTYIKIVTS